MDDENKITDLGKVKFEYCLTPFEEFQQFVLDQERTGQWAMDQGIIEVQIMTINL